MNDMEKWVFSNGEDLLEIEKGFINSLEVQMGESSPIIDRSIHVEKPYAITFPGEELGWFVPSTKWEELHSVTSLYTNSNPGKLYFNGMPYEPWIGRTVSSRLFLGLGQMIEPEEGYPYADWENAKYVYDESRKPVFLVQLLENEEYGSFYPGRDTMAEGVEVYITNTDKPAAFQDLTVRTKRDNPCLRHIQVGDSLNQVFCSAPYDLPAMDEGTGWVISCASGKGIKHETYYGGGLGTVSSLEAVGTSTTTIGWFNEYWDEVTYPVKRGSSYSGLGTVTSINTSSRYYQYLWIFDEDNYRNVQVGDNLAGKTVDLRFPEGPELITPASWNTVEPYSNLITVDGTNYLRYQQYTSSGYYGTVTAYRSGGSDIIYDMWSYEVWFSPTYTFPSGYGIVTSIDNSDPAYKYIYIMEYTP